MKKLFCALLIVSLKFAVIAAEKVDSDICVYGGTAAGVIAAVQAVRMGKTVVLLEFGRPLGGMSSGGLSQPDIGNTASIVGPSREFYTRMGQHYGTNEAWKLEPSVAENIFNDFVRESKIPVYFEQHLSSVKKKGARITEIKMENGNIFRAKEFIDTTYEGDLMAMAKVSYHVGREANSVYGETLNGIREQTPKHQFLVPVDPYKIPGNPKSGLIPFIQKDDLGTPGDGDRTVQAYNFRMCITQVKTNQLPIAPPSDYDASRYELLARYLEARIATGYKPRLEDVMHIQAMPNGKTDINNNGGFSTDFIGGNYDYPDANYKKRAKIWKEHENYMRGMFHFLATNPRVPGYMREEMQSWGLCKDEFKDTGGWPHQLYVREARRMISDYVMTESDCRAKRIAEDSIGLAAYNMDSHNCRRIVRNGHVENEGDVQVAPSKPYPISYRALVPKQSQCDNLFVPVCLSSSHIAYGSIRMEPVFMLLAQSSATAAAHAIEENVAVQKIDYAKLRERLLADKQILEWKVVKPAAGSKK